MTAHTEKRVRRRNLTATVVTAISAQLVSSCANAQTTEDQVFRGTTSDTAKVAVKKYERPKLSPEKPLLLVYPGSGANVPASSSFLIGSTYPGFSVTVQGAKIVVNKEGFFAHVVPLERGSNKFDIKVFNQENTQVYAQTAEITRERTRPGMSAASFEFGANTFEPKENIGLKPGEVIEFAVKASPGCQVTVQLGNKKFALSSIGSLRSARGTKPAPSVNRGLDAAYGKLFQRHPASSPDLYAGLYQIEPSDVFVNEHPRYTLQRGAQTQTTASPATITVVRQPIVVRTAHDDTIVRVAPDLARLTPLPEGVRLLSDGYQGENIRCRYTGAKHIWIKKEDLAFEDTASAAPEAVARTIGVKADSYGETVSIPLNQRLPFLIEQNLKNNLLSVKIYGVKADTDWVYQSPGDSGSTKLIEGVTWKQPEDSVYQVDIDLKGQRQWGYFADFDDNNLNIHIKNAPKIATRLTTPSQDAGLDPASDTDVSANNSSNTGARRLAGLVVCLDPGHGGKETGAIGPSAVREAEMNLAIGLRLRDLLQAEGATVYMTRVDDVDVSLNDRVAFARGKNVDLLISVHNNALPDGRDPNKEHGTSTYWYHPQSQELARVLKNAEAKELGFPDIGARYQNLALCRPSAMQAVLVEVGFVCNPDEYAKLISPTFQDKAARGLVKGLLTYFGRD